jgi:hypothetical protein
MDIEFFGGLGLWILMGIYFPGWIFTTAIMLSLVYFILKPEEPCDAPRIH